MHREVIMAGFGGQGVMTMGKNLVEAGVEEGYEAIWVPSYGPEMRGGTSNCTVVLSDKRIGSPIVEHPSELIAMNRPSLAKFVDSVKSGGTIFVNSSTVSEKVERDDVTTYYVPSDTIAQELGNVKASNMVMLGAYIGATNAVKVETVEQMIHHIFAAKEKLIPLNLDALHKGIESVK
jgi:2-oxoglutarate ferredoxin oxidoreductase subunit gamma